MRKRIIAELKARIEEAARRMDAATDTVEQAYQRGIIHACEGLLDGLERGKA